MQQSMVALKLRAITSAKKKNPKNNYTKLPSLPVSDDQLTLASTDGHQTVHSLDSSLHGLPHRDTRDDARGLQTHTPTNFGAQRTLRNEREIIMDHNDTQKSKPLPFHLMMQVNFFFFN